MYYVINYYNNCETIEKFESLEEAKINSLYTFNLLTKSEKRNTQELLVISADGDELDIEEDDGSITRVDYNIERAYIYEGKECHNPKGVPVKAEIKEYNTNISIFLKSINDPSECDVINKEYCKSEEYDTQEELKYLFENELREYNIINIDEFAERFDNFITFLQY